MIYERAESWFSNKTEKQKKVEVGIGGFKTLAITQQSLSLKSDAPIYYLEDGSYVQNHIILRPKSIRIMGDVGDVWINPDAFKKAQASITSAIGKVTSYLPDQAQALQQKAAALVNDVTDKIRQIDSYINDGAQILDFLGMKADPKPASIQESFIDYMSMLYDTKQWFSVDMPYKTYDDVYIESLMITRSNQSNALRFDLSVIPIRIAEKVYAETSYKNKPSKETAKQTGDKKSKTVTPSQSFLSRGISAGTNAVKSLFGF